MITPLEQCSEWIQRVLGKTLSGVKGVIYTFETPDLKHPQQVQFDFYNTDNSVSFQCGKDGSSLELTDSPLQDTDLGEYGKEAVMDISDLPSLSRVIHKILVKAYAVFSVKEDSYIGVRLPFENEKEVFILNVGDEISIFDFLPLLYEQDDNVKYKEF